ncbi:MAG: leucyl aminopeptidase [Thermoanaerobaculia bacterium]
MNRNLVEVQLATGRAVAGEKVVLGVFADEEPELTRLGAAAARTAKVLVDGLRFRGERERVVETQMGSPGRTLTLIGLGKQAEFTAERASAFVDRAIEAARGAQAASLGLIVPDHAEFAGEAAAERLARRLALASYRFDSFLTKPGGPRLKTATVAVPAAGRRAYASGLALGSAIAEGVALARDLGNTPPNQASPEWMVRQARALARRWGATIRVLGVPELRRHGMGGLLAVGAGSTNPPRLVRIDLGNRNRRGPVVALVGKGITFDTGGISIKPAAQMDEMKWDKMGACAVLGILEAAHRLDLPVRLRAYLALAENMPDGAAYRPGDIVRCANGKTVEITNTDAEGRMVLADALAWAASDTPDAMVEYSTLTGACVVALGQTGAGLFTPSDSLSADLLEAAGAAGERLWRLPLWPEFLEEMRGSHSDLRNSAGRWGGASAAAAFLSQFVGEVADWAHLDIAGPAYVGGETKKRGATGYAVALTVNWLRARAATISGVSGVSGVSGTGPVRRRRRR